MALMYVVAVTEGYNAMSDLLTKMNKIDELINQLEASYTDTNNNGRTNYAYLYGVLKGVVLSSGNRDDMIRILERMVNTSD